MKKIFTIIAATTLLTLVDGCASRSEEGFVPALPQRGYVLARTFIANYTDMYVDYSLYDTKDRPFGMGGRANPFSKRGAAGGHICCAMLPGPGQILRVEWTEGTFDGDPSKKYKYAKDVKVLGSKALPGDSYNYLVTRFFSGHQVEVEFISEEKDGAPSPRLDRLFRGERIMRQIGE